MITKSIIQKWKMEPCDLILIIRLWQINLLLNYIRLIIILLSISKKGCYKWLVKFIPVNQFLMTKSAYINRFIFPWLISSQFMIKTNVTDEVKWIDISISIVLNSFPEMILLERLSDNRNDIFSSWSTYSIFYVLSHVCSLVHLCLQRV